MAFAHPERLKKLLANLQEASIDAILLSSAPNVSYVSGFKNVESWVLVSPKKCFFFTDSRYSEQAEKEATGFELRLRDTKTVTEMVSEAAQEIGARRVGFESDIVTFDFYKRLSERLKPIEAVPTSGLVERIRLYKEPEEIKLIRKSASIAVKGYNYIRKKIKPGMTEKEALAELEYYTKTQGSDKPAFDIIIGAGPGSSMPHYQTGKNKFKNGAAALVDMGVVYEGYHSDLTRTFFLGRMSALQKKVFDTVWKAQRLGIAKAGPGIPAKDVDLACRNYIAEAGYAKFFGHGTGHGVGLEIHEAPSVSSRSQTILKPGMVITVEPGIYLPGQFGVRIEDMVLITKTGREILTKGLFEEN